MMLDDVYGSDQDRFPLEQELTLERESELWAEECPGLEWEETEVRTLAREMSGPKWFADS